MELNLLKIAKQIYSKEIYSYNIKSLSNRIQQYFLNQKHRYQNKRTYNDLSQKQKQQLNYKIEQLTQQIDSFIQKTTNNQEYMNWLCNVIKNGDIPLDNFEYWDVNDEGDSLYFQEIQLLFDNYNIIKKVSKDQKRNNINNFKSLDQLKDYVQNQMKNNEQAVRKKIINIDISKLFGSTNYGKYDVHYLSRQDMVQFQQIYGKTGYSCAWCVATSTDYYITYMQRGYLYLITYANSSKPYALLSFSNYNSDNGIQFRNTHNDLMHNYDADISRMMISLIFDQYAQSGYDAILDIYNELDQSVLPGLNEDFMKTLIDGDYESKYVQILNDQYKKQLFMQFAQKHQNRKLINAIQDHVFLTFDLFDQQFIKCLTDNHCIGILIDYIQNNASDLQDDQINTIIDIYLRNSTNCSFLLKLIREYKLSSLYFTCEQVEYILSKCSNEQDKIRVLNNCSDHMLNHAQLVTVSNLAKETLINWIKTKNNILKNQQFKKEIAEDKLSLFKILYDGLDQNLKNEYKRFIQQ